MSQDAIATLNTLLRGELSAIETYDQAIQSIGESTLSQHLKPIHQVHAQAVTQLQETITSLGGTPSHSSGVWGTFAQAVEGVANTISSKKAVQALRLGEESGLADYRTARQTDGLRPDALTIIDEGIARQEQHLTTLDSIIGTL